MGAGVPFYYGKNPLWYQSVLYFSDRTTGAH